MSVEQRDPAVCDGSNNMGGKGEMTKAPISLQDLRRNLYVKAKAEPNWRFWGLYVHVCKRETLHEAYERARSNNGAPGIDGVTFDAVEESGVESFLEQIRDELVSNTYRPMRARKKEIPKDGGSKIRVLSIPAIRDRVVQGALKLILEPIFEADFQSGSYGYRPKRTARAASLIRSCLARGRRRADDLAPEGVRNRTAPSNRTLPARDLRREIGRLCCKILGRQTAVDTIVSVVTSPRFTPLW